MILKGKVAWITGASGTIGGAIAKRFQEEGAKVFPTSIDIENYAEVKRVAGINPDILVNCAGVYGPYGPVEIGHLSLSWVDTISTNLIGAYYLTQAAIPYMRLQQEGKIIHMSGGGAANGRAFYSAYSASKAGLVRMVECVALEVEEDNIQINAIAPGSVKSKMNPEGTGTPDKAVELALYLASQESNHLTGRLISAIHDDWTKLVSEEAGKLRRTPWTE